MASENLDSVRLKQPAAVDMAQDPARDAETVEKALVKETRSAGAAAYQFDPNAAPEDKARAARSVSSLCCRAQRAWLTRPEPAAEFPS